jgi:hypothetical protein
MEVLLVVTGVAAVGWWVYSKWYDSSVPLHDTNVQVTHIIDVEFKENNDDDDNSFDDSPLLIVLSSERPEGLSILEARWNHVDFRDSLDEHCYGKQLVSFKFPSVFLNSITGIWSPERNKEAQEIRKQHLFIRYQ